MGYNFGCAVASDTLFLQGVGFRGQAIRRRHIVEIEGLWDVAMATYFRTHNIAAVGTTPRRRLSSLAVAHIVV